jgi:hypothetical protein
MEYDKPLHSQLIFIYDLAVKHDPSTIRAKDDPHPVCIVCKCKIIRSTWSAQVRETRQVSKPSGEYEIPFVVDVIDYE